MKTKQIAILSALVIISASSLFAGRTPGGRLAGGLQMAQRVAVVCEDCSLVLAGDTLSQDEAVTDCAESAEVHCSGCGNITRRGRDAKGRPEVANRNKHSMKCMFVSEIHEI